jgi:hypothetical protein
MVQALRHKACTTATKLAAVHKLTVNVQYLSAPRPPG